MKTTAHFNICLSVWIVFKGWLYLSVCFFLGLVVRAGCVCLFVSLFVFFMFVSLFVCLLELVVNAGCFCLFVYLRIGSEGWCFFCPFAGLVFVCLFVCFLSICMACFLFVCLFI